MKYAIIKLSGRQFRVEEGMDLTVDRLPQAEKVVLTITEVLLMVDGDKIHVGTPYVAGVKVNATITAHERGEKLRVATYKAKSKERKVHGHRQAETVLHINTISAK